MLEINYQFTSKRPLYSIALLLDWIFYELGVDIQFNLDRLHFPKDTINLRFYINSISNIYVVYDIKIMIFLRLFNTFSNFDYYFPNCNYFNNYNFKNHDMFTTNQIACQMSEYHGVYNTMHN